MFRLVAISALLLSLTAVSRPALAAAYADELKLASARMLDCYGGGDDVAQAYNAMLRDLEKPVESLPTME